ncbi:MAG: hypothetical protein FWE15_04730 [Actinomycetia bacterium]|nr:hypothetical protein [Actinomycetes bacterium]
MKATERRRDQTAAIHADKTGMLAELDTMISEHSARRKSHSTQAEDTGLRDYQRAAHRTLRSYESGVADGLAMARKRLARWAEADTITMRTS